MTAPVRDLPSWLRTILPGLRGDVGRAVADFLAVEAEPSAIVTTPANPAPAGTSSTLFSGSTPNFRRTLVDLIPSIPMTGGVLQVPNMTVGPNGATSHAEGFPKTEASLVFAGNLRKAASIATWVSVTDELLDDVAGLDAWLSTFLGYLVKLAEERSVLLGNGIATPIVGFFNSGIPVYAGTKTDDAEVVAEMLAQATAQSGIVPDTVVVSGSIWAGLAKSPTNVLDLNDQTFAGCDVIVSPALAETQILVGPCQSLSVIGREGGIVVEGTRSHALDFVSNKSAIRAQSRLALGILMTSAFVSKT